METLDAFEVAFDKAQDYFNKKGEANNDRIVFDYEKGLNKEVMAAVSVMLLRGDENLNINHLRSRNLDAVMARLDYKLFDPYIRYLIEKPNSESKMLSDKKATMYNHYQVAFVLCIYKLRALNARRAN